MAAWAIVVGINDYGELAKQAKLDPLNGAVADALDMTDWLLDPDGGNVAPDNLFLWTCPAPQPTPTTPQAVKTYLANPTAWPLFGPDFNRAPRVGELIGGISQINRKAMAAGATRLYVYLAGHGAQVRPPNLGVEPKNCFILGDYQPDAESAALMNCDSMHRYLQSQGPAEVVIFLDCCRNRLPLRISEPGAGFSNPSAVGVNTRLGILRAAQDESVAYEVPRNRPAERGAFTQLLTYGLREIRENGVLTVRRLEEFVTDALIEVVKPDEQFPDFAERSIPPRLVLTSSPPKGTLAAVTLLLSTPPAGSNIELRDKDDAVIQMLKAGPEPIRVELPRGSYSLELDGAELKTFNHVGPGTPDVVV